MDVAKVLITTSASEAPLDPAALTRLAGRFSTRDAQKGTHLARQGEPQDSEFLILGGQAISHISDQDGRSICVAFHAGPSVVTPHLARTLSGNSLVTIEMVTDGQVAKMSAGDLMSLMVADEMIREWANAIMRREIHLKAEREWCLAALKSAERLSWFRERFPRHEELFGHAHIASFLGMTPVTLSRARHPG